MRMRYNFGVHGSGFMVQGSWFRVHGSGFMGGPEGVLPLDGGMRSLLELGMKDLSVAEF